MTRRLTVRLASFGAAALLLALDATALPAQADPWHRLVAEADSVGPETPDFAPSPWIECGAGVERADSVQVSGAPEGVLFARRSMRTRGYFDYVDLPPAGAARFAVRSVLCDEERGHPITFVLERDHRYFYVLFSLRDHPTYVALAFRSPSGDWRPFLWDPARRTFAARGGGTRPGERTGQPPLPACAGMEPFEAAVLPGGGSMREGFEALAARVRADPDARPVLVPGATEPRQSNLSEVGRLLPALYPPDLRDTGVEGTTTVAFLVDADGKGRYMQVTRSSGHREMDVAALRFAQALRFHPATADGCRVPSFVHLPIRFTLAR